MIPGFNSSNPVQSQSGSLATTLHHVAVVVTALGTELSLYVDGNDVINNAVYARGTFTGMQSTGVATLGTNVLAFPGYSWTGYIDEVAIWSYARYTGAVYFQPPTQPYTGHEQGLVALYHLNGDATDSNSTTKLAGTVGLLLY